MKNTYNGMTQRCPDARVFPPDDRPSVQLFPHPTEVQSVGYSLEMEIIFATEARRKILE